MDKINLSDYIEEIEKTPVLINKFGGLQEVSNIDEIIKE